MSTLTDQKIQKIHVASENAFLWLKSSKNTNLEMNIFRWQKKDSAQNVRSGDTSGSAKSYSVIKSVKTEGWVFSEMENISKVPKKLNGGPFATF